MIFPLFTGTSVPCPFCKNELTPYEVLGYSHLYCEKDKVKLMYDPSTSKCVLFRIFFSEDFAIEIDNRHKDGIKLFFMFKDKSTKSLNIPLFDVCKYSREELYDKLKKYLLFL